VDATEVLHWLSRSVEVCRRQSVSGFSFETAEVDVDARKSGSEAVLGHIWNRALQRRGGRGVASVMQAVVELAGVAKEVGDAEALLSRVRPSTDRT